MGFLLQLSKLERGGRLERRKNGAFAIAAESTMLGRLMSLSRGFGFARLDDGSGDCFIAGRNLHGALPGDTVRLLPGPKDERGISGEVVCIVEKGARLYSGRLSENEYGVLQIEPDGFFRYPLEISRSSAASTGAKLGDKVRFSAEWDGREVMAEIITSYGSADSARVCADALIDSYGIPSAFDAEVLADAAAKSAQPLDAAVLAGRRDLRGLPILTIDGSDAKDLDDAVSLEKIDGRLAAGGAHRRRLPLCHAGFPGGCRGVPPRHVGVFCRPGYPDAARNAVERCLFTVRGRGPADHDGNAGF